VTASLRAVTGALSRGAALSSLLAENALLGFEHATMPRGRPRDCSAVGFGERGCLGSGSFENDDALDFSTNLAQQPDPGLAYQTLLPN
jgi:hypothetical protein